MPKLVDHQDRRREIARAAITVIADGGLEGLRLRDVAEAVSSTTGAVTHYFASKDAVLEAALQEVVDTILEMQEVVLQTSGQRTVEDLVSGVAEFLPLDEARRSDWRVWFAFWGRAVNDERLRALHADYYRRITERLASALGRLQHDNLISARTSAGELADAVVAAVDGLGVRATLEPESWPAQRQVSTLRAMLLPMISPTAIP